MEVKKRRFYNENDDEVKSMEDASYVLEEREMTLDEFKKEYPLSHP